MIRVYNITFHGKPKAANEVYIGCWTPKCSKLGILPSPLGNRLARDTSMSPQEQVRGYKEWLRSVIAAQEPLSYALRELRRLHGFFLKHGELKLYCWCSPEEPLTSKDEPFICHGQVLAKQIELEDRAFEAIMVWAMREGPPPFTEKDIDEGNLPRLTEEEKARIDEVDIEAVTAEGMKRMKEQERGHAGEAEKAGP